MHRRGRHDGKPSAAWRPPADPLGLALVAGGLLVALGAAANPLVQHSAAAASLKDQARHLAQVIQAFRLSEAA